ncbi:MAG: heme transporter HemC [Alphaproteobacteria bacterium]|nr:heme transporter HemC [Alphaproteobacteria bacterium]
MIRRLTHPKFLLRKGEALLPWSMAATGLFGCVGLLLSFFFSPPDYQQGESVRIMYIHVPASWGALSVYTFMAILSGWGFVTRASLPHLITKAIAPIGIAFTLISLGTGAIWGKPTWGTWWAWDARLTSMLLLLFLYLGYWTLVTLFDDEEKALSAGAVIALIGWINIPIIKWSVEWWHTLHQPASVFRLAKPAIHWTMLAPLFSMAMAFAAYGFSIAVIRIRTEINIRKIRSHQLREGINQNEKLAA